MRSRRCDCDCCRVMRAIANFVYFCAAVIVILIGSSLLTYALIDSL